MTGKLFLAGLAALFAAIFLPSPVLSGNSTAAGQKLKVAASISPLADFARQVGGDRVDVTLILPPGASPHTFEPPPKTVQEIARSRIFIEIGAGLEFWADRLIAASAPGITTVNCSEGMPLIRGGGRGHALSDVDPHIWLDPVLCIKIIGKIENAFSRADPANAPYYRKNASAYEARLAALDREIATRVAAFREREFITFHSAWSYFAKRYGLKVAGVIEEGPGKEPTAKHLNDLLKTIRSMRTKVVFAEPQFSTRIAEAIAKEAGARVLVLDPEGGKGREKYIDLMKYNVSVMEQAMR